MTKADLLHGRDKTFASEYTAEISKNLDNTLSIIQSIEDQYHQETGDLESWICNSGWRPAAINGSTPGAAAHSAHMVGNAVDISDVSGKIFQWVLTSLDLMQGLGVYLEDPRWCPTWTHFGTTAPKSGKRIFVPSAARPQAPDRWNGEYDHEYDTAV